MACLTQLGRDRLESVAMSDMLHTQWVGCYIHDMYDMYELPTPDQYPVTHFYSTPVLPNIPLERPSDV
jgi:hypothetical protein